MNPFIPQPLPIKEIAWERLIPLIGKANRSLAHYEGVLYGVPNPEVLLSPLTTQEAVLSSKIEGTQASLGEVLKFEAGEIPTQEARKQDIHEILNYRNALTQAEQALKKKPFNLNLLLALHSTLLNSVRGRDKGRGKFRTSQNWIGSPGSSMEEAEFVPPAPLTIMHHLDIWEKYYHSDLADPLVQLAVVHAQFEIIHPFVDGNGRLGRILVPLFLHEKGLLSRPMFYLSAYLEKNRDEYIARLRNIGRDDSEAWNKWIEFFLGAIESEARANAQKARTIMDLYAKLKGRVIAITRSAYAIPLLDQLFARPLFLSTSLKFSDAKGPSRQLISLMLRKLEGEQIIKYVRRGSGRRPHVMCLAELLNICEGKKVI
jgi:Fic family protein